MTDWYGEAACYFPGCDTGAIFHLYLWYGGMEVLDLDTGLNACDEHAGHAWIDCYSVCTPWLPRRPYQWVMVEG